MGGRAVGRVAQIWIYPVKSLAGTALPEVAVAEQGLVGDRARVVVDDAGQPVRAKDVPVLATLSPAGADDAALSAALGRPVRLEPLAASPDGAPVHLVSRRAVERAAHGEVPAGCSADDPRANLVLDLHTTEDGRDDERAWVGATVQVGDVLLDVTRTPKHCLGVYARVRRAGTVAVGDAVLL